MNEQERLEKTRSLAQELKNWDSMNVKQRADLMQRIENHEAMCSDRPAARVSLGYLPSNCRGQYNRDTNEITQNHDMVKYGNSDMSLKNVLHEGRHAFQWHTVQNPDSAQVPAHTVQQWQDNFNNYIPGNKDVALYASQPLETDARGFAESRSQEYTQSLVQGQENGTENGQGRSAGQDAGQGMGNTGSEGPGGGQGGGQVVAEGTPEDLAKTATTPTGLYLKKYL